MCSTNANVWTPKILWYWVTQGPGKAHLTRSPGGLGVCWAPESLLQTCSASLKETQHLLTVFMFSVLDRLNSLAAGYVKRESNHHRIYYDIRY